MSKILIADDAAFMRMMIKNTLKRLGYDDVDEAYDRQIAVNKFNEISPNPVIPDITMPNMVRQRQNWCGGCSDLC